MTSGPRRRRSAKPTSPATQDDHQVADAAVAGAAGDRGLHLSSSTVNRVIFRLAVLCGAILVYMYNKKHEDVMAAVGDDVGKRSQQMPCSANFSREIAQFPGCEPVSCGRVVSDRVVTLHEAQQLKAVAMKAFTFTGGSVGGASILDLQSGAVSSGENFINIFKLPHADKLISPNDLALYRSVCDKVLRLIAEHFSLSPDALHLTQPSFLSRITDTPARTLHDQYWHVHVDKETYPTFHYTGLVYLSDFGSDFGGGRFIFHDALANVTVQPRAGRVLAFTSGWENRHQVEPVSRGVRYALTVAFSCRVTSNTR